MSVEDFELAGTRGTVVVHRWPNPGARYIALLSHGYGEHARRYDHVAERLVADGAVVYAPDHHGHGRSDGERALVHDLDRAVEDMHTLAGRVSGEHPGLPTVLIGHSMGGLIATRYGQRFGGELKALVLSGPAVGGNPDLEGLAQLDPIPDIPIDPAILSRDLSVGQAYADDPLVYHGPFKRETLMGLGAAVQAVAEGGTFGSAPDLLDSRGRGPARAAGLHPPRHGARPRRLVRGEDLPGRPPRGVQRDEQGRSHRRRPRLHRQARLGGSPKRQSSCPLIGVTSTTWLRATMMNAT